MSLEAQGTPTSVISVLVETDEHVLNSELFFSKLEKNCKTARETPRVQCTGNVLGMWDGRDPQGSSRPRPGPAQAPQQPHPDCLTIPRALAACASSERVTRP